MTDPEDVVFLARQASAQALVDVIGEALNRNDVQQALVQEPHLRSRVDRIYRELPLELTGPPKLCPAGHAQVPPTVRYTRRGKRYCGECRRAASARYRADGPVTGHGRGYSTAPKPGGPGTLAPACVAGHPVSYLDTARDGRRYCARCEPTRPPS